MTLHRQTLIEHDYFQAEVDVELAPLILGLWRAGLMTTMSCQEDDAGRAWLSFVDLATLERFLRQLFPKRKPKAHVESLYNRAVGTYEPHDWQEFREKRKWTFTLIAVDLNDLAQLETETTYVSLVASVRFPRADIAAVTERVRRLNAAAKEQES
jgi:hypothetical protein